MERPRSRQTAMTLVEILVVIAVITILIALLLPPRQGLGGTPGGACMNHLRQIDIGFILYTQDNGGKFPMQQSITNGGTMEFLQRNQTFPHYEKVAAYLSPVQILICPCDKSKRAGTDYNTLSDANLSYFLNADVSTNNPSTSILAGDRNVQANGRPTTPGVLFVSTNVDVSFTSELHPGFGVVAFADGHVEACRKSNFNEFIRRQNQPSFRLSIP